MRLADYLEDQNMSDAEFARAIGVERQAVGRYRSGDRFPEKSILLKIFQATGGLVSANDFAGLPAAPEPERAAG